VNSKPQLLKVASKDISGLFDASVMICAADLGGELNMRYVEGTDTFHDEREKAAMMETYRSGMASGAGKELFNSCGAYYLPVSGPSGVLGVIGIAFPDKYVLSESQKMFLDTISAQIALALERERLFEKQQRTKMEIEKERLRGDLLRSVSHDLRTPLTSIMGSVGTMIENYDDLDDTVRKEFLSDVYSEAEWLSTLVENILSLTRLEGGKITLHKEMEAVEEIVAEAVSRVKKRAGQHEIEINIPQELILIPMDGTLIEQVLVNLLDNAIKHTPADSSIAIAVREEGGKAVFEVSDNGNGIPENDLPFIFDRYFTRPSGNAKRHSIGIGLSICKSIVETHGGIITAKNKTSGGAIFRFTLPMEE
jgi:two-component system sensor histidine kinase KdpD